MFSKKKGLTAKDILNASDIEIELVEVPEWGGSVWVKGMTGAERDKYEADMFPISVRERSDREKKFGESKPLNLTDLRAKLCSMTICNEKGVRLFTEKDIKALTKKSAAGLQRVFVVAQRLSGITDEDIKEMAEGLEERPFEGSASDSQGI